MKSDSPSSWLTENIDLIPRDRPVLDVACGQGRHTVFLAASGWAVHAVDRDAARLAVLCDSARGLAGSVTVETIDLERGTPSLGSQLYGAVLVFNYLYRPLVPIIVQAVAPGGVLIYETFTVGQAQRGHPRNPAFLLQDGELASLVAPLEILRSREGEFDGRLVASVVARRRQPAKGAP